MSRKIIFILWIALLLVGTSFGRFNQFKSSPAEVKRVINQLENELQRLQRGEKGVGRFAKCGFQCPKEMLRNNLLIDQYFDSNARIKVIKQELAVLKELLKMLTTSSSYGSSGFAPGQFIGCFRDRGEPYGLKGRDLDGFAFSSEKMTPQLCMRECARRGFSYAGVQANSYCFCGNSYGRYGGAPNCNLRCSGNSNQICGGSWANSIYSVAGLGVPRLHYGPGIEVNTDRPGLDYKSFNLPYPDYRLCQKACEKETQCKAWTYVRPYTIQGTYARCWLKGNVPKPVKRNCCISGVKQKFTGPTRTFRYPRIKGYRLDWCRLWAQDGGQGAADAFCKRIGYKRAVSFEEDYDIGAKSPTYIIDSGQICNQGFCDGFKYITCAGQLSKTAKVFRDDFNFLNLSVWEVYQWKTLRRLNGSGLAINGVLNLACNRVDMSPFVASKPIPIKAGEIFVLRRRVKVHYANQYFEGGIWFYQTDGSKVQMPMNRRAWLSAFGRWLFQVTYYNYYYEKPGVRQYVPAKHGFVLSGINWRNLKNYGVLQPLWDRWFVEEIIYDPETSVVRYRMNGREITARAAPLNAPYIRFIMHSSGWYTGHNVQIDWVEWSVRPQGSAE